MPLYETKFSLCLVQHLAVKVYGEEEVQLHTFLMQYVETNSFTLRQIYSRGKSPRNPFVRKLGGSWRKSELGGEENNLTPAGNQTRLARSHALFHIQHIEVKIMTLLYCMTAKGGRRQRKTT
jgi:hypothetical protein